ncbi:MAG: endonuclease/exonuclease/phosphatase family protein [Planktomarina sp.]
MRSLIRFLYIIGAVAVSLVILGSYLGALIPLGDSLAVIRIPVALLGCIYLFTLRRFPWTGLTVVLAIFALASTLIDRTRDTGPAGAYVLYQKNLWYQNQELPAVVADIRAQNADFVTIQEVSSHNQIILEMLKDDYPYQHFCPLRTWTGTAVLSRHPLTQATPQCSQWRAFSAAQFDTSDGPVWVISLHLFWPYPKSQSAQLGRILPRLTEINGPIMLGGDFNMLPGTRVEGAVSNAINATPLRPVFPTLYVGDIPVSIDQIMAKCGVVQRRPKLGSDHHGLVANVGFNERSCR